MSDVCAVDVLASRMRSILLTLHSQGRRSATMAMVLIIWLGATVQDQDNGYRCRVNTTNICLQARFLRLGFGYERGSWDSTSCGPNSKTLRP